MPARRKLTLDGLCSCAKNRTCCNFCFRHPVCFDQTGRWLVPLRSFFKEDKGGIWWNGVVKQGSTLSVATFACQLALSSQLQKLLSKKKLDFSRIFKNQRMNWSYLNFPSSKLSFEELVKILQSLFPKRITSIIKNPDIMRSNRLLSSSWLEYFHSVFLPQSQATFMPANDSNLFLWAVTSCFYHS